MVKYPGILGDPNKISSGRGREVQTQIYSSVPPAAKYGKKLFPFPDRIAGGVNPFFCMYF